MHSGGDLFCRRSDRIWLTERVPSQYPVYPPPDAA